MSSVLRNFELPKKIEWDTKTYGDTYGKFMAEPFERGYGITIGNSLRRVLLSSLEGVAVTSVKISGAQHEFSSIEGVLEDTPQIILNIKKLIFRSYAKDFKNVYIKTDKIGEIKAKDIITDESVEVLNPDLHILTLTKKKTLEIEMTLARGRGYVSAENFKKENQLIGTINVDALFSPVTKVNFYVEDTRVGQMTDYDKLIMEVWTNGSLVPKDALLSASHVLEKHLEIFLSSGTPKRQETIIAETTDDGELYKMLAKQVTELELSVRSSNCLKEAKIKTLANLVDKTEAEMLKYRNFGKKSLMEIRKILQDMGLSFGMKIDKDKLKQVQSESGEKE